MKASDTYLQASKHLKRVGTAHAAGTALAAMYADLIAAAHGGRAERYYAALCVSADMQDHAAAMLRDRAVAWDALIATGSDSP